MGIFTNSKVQNNEKKNQELIFCSKNMENINSIIFFFPILYLNHLSLSDGRVQKELRTCADSLLRDEIKIIIITFQYIIIKIIFRIKIFTTCTNALQI